MAETARRMLFLANIVNYYASKDPSTDELSPYYEPLDDGLICNLSLPSSTAAWTARSEEDWLGTMASEKRLHNNDGDSVESTALNANGMTLNTLFSSYTKDDLRSNFDGECGMQGSDSFRRLVVRCAVDQYL